MPLSDRNIVITPNIGASAEPQIRFTGADTATSATILLKVYNSGTVGQISLEGSAGQLFSITDSLTGSIFSVNDISGIPSLEVFDTGEVRMTEFGGFVSVRSTTSATSTTTGALRVTGGMGIGGNLYVGGEIVAEKLTIQLTTVTTTLIQTDDVIKTTNTTNATSTITGALIVSGGAGIGGNLAIGGALYAGGTSGTNGQVLSSTGNGIQWSNASALLGTSGFSGWSGISGFSGWSGISGFSGWSGISGFSGWSGVSGFSGWSGISGFSGWSGISGFSGWSGISGFSGWSGTAGAGGTSGFSGWSGISGFSGWSGISGFSGWSGRSGFSGWSGSGVSGFSGWSGTAGAGGTSGFSGWSGISGFSGWSGSGVSGFSGWSGAAGAGGTSGFSGWSGISGFSGWSGISGFSGWSGSGVSGFSGWSGISGWSGRSGFSGWSGSGVSGFSGWSGISGTSGFPGNGFVYQYTVGTTATVAGRFVTTATTASLVATININPVDNTSTQLDSFFNYVDNKLVSLTVANSTNTNNKVTYSVTGFDPISVSYNGYKAFYSKIWGNDPGISKILFYNDKYRYRINDDKLTGLTNDDTFLISNISLDQALTGNEVGGLITLWTNNSSFTPTVENLRQYFKEFVDRVITPANGNISAVRTNFYTNTNQLTDIVESWGQSPYNFQFYKQFGVNSIYQSVAQSSTSGSGTGFTATVILNGDSSYVIRSYFGGTGYAVNNTITINGDQLGGTTSTNNLVITVTSVNGSGTVTGLTNTGTHVGLWPTYAIDDGGNDQYDTVGHIITVDGGNTALNYNSGTVQTHYSNNRSVMGYSYGQFMFVSSSTFLSDSFGTTGETGSDDNSNSRKENGALLENSYWTLEIDKLLSSTGTVAFNTGTFNFNFDIAGANIGSLSLSQSYSQNLGDRRDNTISSPEDLTILAGDLLLLESPGSIYIRGKNQPIGTGETGADILIASGHGTNAIYVASPVDRDGDQTAGSGGSITIRTGNGGDVNGDPSGSSNGGPLTFETGVGNGLGSAGPMYFRTGITTRLYLSSTGDFGIGTETPTQILEVSGRAKIDTLTIGRGGQTSVGSNTAIGYQALDSASLTGSGNTAVGFYALNKNLSSSNSAVGSSALYNNTSGYRLVAIGDSALYNNATGGFNTAVGFQSLYNNNGDSNTGVGHQVLYGSFPGTGSKNTAIGDQALTYNTTGNDNSAVGYQALQLNTTGTNNTAVGSRALWLNGTGSRNTAVGREALKNPSSTYDNSGVGYQTLTAVSSGIKNSGFGSQSLASNTSGNENTAIGFQSLYSNTIGYNNIAVGNSTLFNNISGYYNVGVGSNVLYFNNTGYYNIGIGQSTLYNNTSGSFNIAIGYQALYYNTTSTLNIAIGYQALTNNTTGTENVAVGNTALVLNTTGINNTAVGKSALSGNTTGTNNTAVGFTAGYLITTGSKNTILGSYSGNQGGLNITTSSNYIVLSDGDGNPRVIVNDGGNVGIGVTPSAWGSTGTVIRSLQIGTASWVGGGSGFNNFYSGSNCYFDGTNWRYTTNAAASLFEQAAGEFKWFNAASGTATNTFNFTERMKIESTGNVVFKNGITENVFTITDGASVDINPANGTIQLWTLGASRTPTASSFAAGQSVTLMILDGTAYSITWTTIGVTWVGGTAPVLDTTKYTVIELWKVSTTVYGALVGYA